MNEIKMAFVGDIMPGGLLHYSKASFIDEDVLGYLSKFDLRIGTLECALGNDLEYYRSLMNEQGRNKNIIYAKNSDISRLKKLNLDLVTIANNHIFDLGKEGLINTISILEENKIKYCGAGMNIDEAAKPAVIELNNKTLAFIGCADIIPSSPYPAGIDIPGFNPLDIEKLVTDIQKAKEKYDYVFVLPHWGSEYTYFPSVECKDIAHKMILAGADGIFGGHSHVVQPHVFYKKKPIVFSMRNFLFPNRFVQPPAPTYYPENLVGLSDIPTSASPHCTKITLKTWIPKARIGMIAGVFLSTQIKLNRRFTQLSSSDKIEFYSQSTLSKLFFEIVSFMIKWCYRPFVSFIKLLKFAKRMTYTHLKK
jgi:poly-gamma-glutamate synthesis protein (capsule biosynthesis protein)